jgi:hypothetical protein
MIEKKNEMETKKNNRAKRNHYVRMLKRKTNHTQAHSRSKQSSIETPCELDQRKYLQTREHAIENSH